MLRVGVTELNIGFENREEAKKCCLEVMEEASANGVELLVFPEMTLTGFTMRPWLYAESWDADNIPDSVSFFMENSRKYKMKMAFGYIRAVMADSDKMDDETKEPVYENRKIKEMIAYIPDELFYFLQSDAIEMMHYYKGIYPAFDEKNVLPDAGIFPCDRH